MGISETIVAVTLSLMMSTGIEPTKASFNETTCMAEAIFFETSHRSKQEKEAVANVILNRRKSGTFPDDICDITHQRGQFSYQRPGKNKFVTEQQSANIENSVLVALKALGQGIKDNTNGATHFVNLSIARNTAWLSNMRQVKTIGPHTFFVQQRRSHGGKAQDDSEGDEAKAR